MILGLGLKPQYLIAFVINISLLMMLTLPIVACSGESALSGSSNEIRGENTDMAQPSASAPDRPSLHGLEVASYSEAQSRVFFQLHEPTYVPSSLSLYRIALFVPPAEMSPSEGQRQEALQRLRTDEWRSLGIVWVTSVYRGPEGVWKPTDGYVVVEQGNIAPPAMMETYPEDARGEITLADGSKAAWVRGAWNRRPGTPGAQWRDTGEVTLYWQKPDGIAIRLHIFYMPFEEGVRIANSFRPVPRG